MHISNEIFTAHADSINNSGAHLFWADNPDQLLTDSIEEFGQSAPVLVHESKNGLNLVAGNARLSVLHNLGRPVLARIVEDMNEVDKGLLYLTDNLQRPMDDGMRLKALEFFAPLMDEKTLKSNILPRLGLKPKSKDAKLLTGWLSMDQTWRNLLKKGNIPLASATPLSRMTDEDRQAIEPLFTGFSWSRSNAVNILNWLFETAKMNDQSVQEVMHTAGIVKILSQGLSPKDSIARLTNAARLARYPELTKLQERFTAAAGEITTGTRWRMVQPNNFETGGAELTVQIKDTEQLKRAVAEMTDLANAPAWEKLWKLGSGND
nr:ParB/RepB/Spo0J family partition protein [uncultured Pseudodesulfovibrio sp.]